MEKQITNGNEHEHTHNVKGRPNVQASLEYRDDHETPYYALWVRREGSPQWYLYCTSHKITAKGFYYFDLFFDERFISNRDLQEI